MTVDTAALVASAERAAFAEVAWHDPAAGLTVAVLTPLVDEGTLRFALPFSSSEMARALDAVDRVALVLSDSRLALKGWRALAAEAPVTVRRDMTGDWAETGMLEQELRKHLPSRRLIDTPIQRREHWWYLPRWIVTVGSPTHLTEIGRRGPADGVLIAGTGRRLRADTVGVQAWDADDIRLVSLTGHGSTEVPSGPAVLFTHDVSLDGERRTQLLLRGTLTDRRLRVRSREGARTLPPPPALWQRVRDRSRLARACRNEITAWRD